MDDVAKRGSGAGAWGQNMGGGGGVRGLPPVEINMLFPCGRSTGSGSVRGQDGQ